MRRCCRNQNMNAQWAVSDSAQTSSDQHGRPTDRAAKQLDKLGGCCSIDAVLGRLPFVGLGHRPTNPQHQECRQNADQEDGAIRLAQATATVDRASPARMPMFTADLQHGRHPRPPAGGATSPRVATRRPPTRRRCRGPPETDRSKCHQVWAKNDRPVKHRVGENRQHQRPAAAEAIADPAEEAAAQRPADQERAPESTSCIRPTASSRVVAATTQPRTESATSV